MEELLPNDLDMLVSPFLGSGRVEYFVARQRPHVQVLGADSFKHVVNFHQCKGSEKLLKKLQEFIGFVVTKEEHARMMKAVDTAEKYTAAAYMFMLMHYSFHGKFGSYAGSRPPITEKTLKELGNSLSNLTVEENDVFTMLSKLRKDLRTVVYLDPPYICLHDAPCKRYYALQRQGDNREFHVKLRDMLLELNVPFIMSLNDTPFARELYQSCHIRNLPKTYRRGKDTVHSTELLIVSWEEPTSKRSA